MLLKIKSAWLVILLMICMVFALPVGAQSNIISPLVAPDGTVTFQVAAPNAKSVRVSGDFTPHSVEMKRNNLGIWIAKVGPLKPDLYGYNFEIDGQSVPDPSNNYVKVGAYWFGSQVEVPGPETAYMDAHDGPHGVVHEHWYYSNGLKAVRRVLVYTPSGYKSDKSSGYPVLYLLHGYGDDETNWTTVGRANLIMDNLIAAGKAVPALIVMPYGHQSRQIGWGASSNLTITDEGRALEADLKQNVIPLVEQNYNVRTDSESRAIAGISMGGFQAIMIGLNNPDQFAWVAGFSSAFIEPLNLDAFLSKPANEKLRIRLLWLGCGSLDSLLYGNQRFIQDLKAKGIPCEWVETPGYDHGWLLWRPYLRDLIPRLFRPKQ